MSLYDTIFERCPNCGIDRALEFQSKGGECLMRNFTLDDAPEDVLSDVNRHSPQMS